ncbi:helix-turn-helix transcriptional regulator [Pedobacter frigiditerrae]|uniref:helix-turn-helix domain-containing protein n=1 Tax=Pedobacter frigiditerrae TaxID=2530452 RepID=UPI00292F8C68|nr:helix-turn-helix transcriptional regulator [Pedobacter frigiditerrae]
MEIEIGNVLKKLRKKQKVNQADVAKYLLISRPTYLRYENNKIEIPLSKLFKLADYYEINFVELMKLIEIEKNQQEDKSAAFKGNSSSLFATAV